MLIGITGQLQAGKSTAAMHLVLRYGFQRRSMAAPIRRECARMLAFVDDVPAHVIEEAMRKTGIKEDFRGLLQWYGMWRRRDDPDYWIHRIRPTLEIILARHQHVVIDDIRFINEAAMIHELGGKIITVHRDDLLVDAACDHESEHDWIAIPSDADVWNDTGAQEEFCATVAREVEQWM